MSVEIFNYSIRKHILPETIDRTVNSILRKETIEQHNTHYLNGQQISIDKSWLNNISDFLGSLFEVPKWYNNEYREYTNNRHASNWKDRCDCCGRYSPDSCYCKRCEEMDYHNNLTNYVKEKNYEEAMKTILYYSKNNS